MFTDDRESQRRFFLETWRKRKAELALEPLEELVAQVMLQHPEYHAVLEDEDTALDRHYAPEAGVTNPFLHMGMHIAIQEQLLTDRPKGILVLYQTGLKNYGDPHKLEHEMMECLGEVLWSAQRNNTAPDEKAYLNCLRQIVA